MRRRLAVLTTTGLVVGLVLAPSPALAQLKPSSPIFVIDVSTDQTRMAVVSAKTFNEALTTTPPPAGEATPLERYLDACTTVDPDPDPDRQRAALQRRLEFLTKLKDCVDCLKAHQETRYFTDRNQDVALIVLFADPIKPEHIRPYFNETPRDSELVATAKALAKIVRESVGLDCRAFTYTLQRKRSTFKITLSGLPAPSPTAASKPAVPAGGGLVDKPAGGGLIDKPAVPAAAAAGPPVRPDVITPEVVLGPVEHWFLSADFSFSAGDIQLGKTPAADAEQLKNNDFFVGVNFSLGDLLADRESPLQRRSIWQEIVVKAQLTPSLEPWEAWAVGVGVRGYRIRTILWNMDVVHPYFTIGRQKGEDDTWRWRAVFGLGFDPRSLKK